LGSSFVTPALTSPLGKVRLTTFRIALAACSNASRPPIPASFKGFRSAASRDVASASLTGQSAFASAGMSWVRWRCGAPRNVHASV
jgi:hypothetical protein